MSVFEVYAPLKDFRWSGEDFELAPDIWIKRFKEIPNFGGLEELISTTERKNAFAVTHWLTFHWSEDVHPSSNTIANLVLLSLWIANPSETHVAFLFDIGLDTASDVKRLNRERDQFQWIPGEEYRDFEESDIQLAASFYKHLYSIHSAHGRLNDALILMLGGCWASFWQVAFISHAAAVEAILTYRKGPGITQRLAKAYAYLIECEAEERAEAIEEFTKMYDVRSDIMHGRTHNVDIENRLRVLADFQNVVRRLWRSVLSSPELIKVLEGTDEQRETHFNRLHE